MVDIVDKKTRSRMMSGIRGKGTAQERLIKSILDNYGIKYHTHDKSLPGNPDFVIPSYNAVIFAQGCFWHGHGCHMFKWPKARKSFWRKKITGNTERDRKNIKELKKMGWWILEVWECATRGKRKLPANRLEARIVDWVFYETRSKVIEAPK